MEAARALLRHAKTADELRAAQAVLLPLELGLSLEQTAAAIGRSRTATCLVRTCYCKVASGQRPPARSKHALRNHAKASLVQEPSCSMKCCAKPAKEACWSFHD